MRNMWMAGMIHACHDLRVRRRGYTPESIRDFCDRVGIAKREILADLGLLEFCVRNI